MIERPPAFHTLVEFLEYRSAYPDDSFRSLKMGMLRDLRSYIHALEAEAKVKRRPELVPLHERDKLIAEVAKAAIEAICTGRSK